MASLMSGVIQTYNALTASGFPNSTRPSIFIDRAPEVVSGVQLYPPYLVVSLTAGEVLETFESLLIEESRLKFVAFASSQADADQIIAAIRFNSQNLDQIAGFDNASSLTGFSDGTLLSILPTRSPVVGQAGIGKTGAVIKKTEMEYIVSVQRS